HADLRDRLGQGARRSRQADRAGSQRGLARGAGRHRSRAARTDAASTIGDSMFELTDKTALVTGATGGIGGALARALHKQGATVAVSGRQTDKLDKLASELGSRVHVLACDLG